MESKINEIVLGAFIVGAFLILFGAVIYFVPQHFLDTTRSFIMYFQGSLKGLHVGSDVTYRGIKIGEVTKIKLIENNETGQLEVPVYVQFFRNTTEDSATESNLKHLVGIGLRAQLVTENFLTGDANVEIVFRPDTKVDYRHPDKGEYPEIPTIITPWSRLSLSQALQMAGQSLEGFGKFAGSPEAKQLFTNFSVTLKQMKMALTSINNQLVPVTVNMNSTLQEFREAAASFRVLTDYLSVHPEALIAGKSKQRRR